MLKPNQSVIKHVVGNAKFITFTLNVDNSTALIDYKLAVDLDFEQPLISQGHSMPRPVALLHNASEVPPLESVHEQLVDRLAGGLSPEFQESFITADFGAYHARLLKSGFVSPWRDNQAVSVYNIAVQTDLPRFPNGTLTLTLLNEQLACAGYFEGNPCNSQGSCSQSFNINAHCFCKPLFTAPLCTEPFSRFSKGERDKSFNEKDFEVETSLLRESYIGTVQPLRTAYVALNYTELSMKEGYEYNFSVRILRPAVDEGGDSLRCEIASTQQGEDNDLPRWDDDRQPFNRSPNRSFPDEANITFKVQRGASRYMIALFANATRSIEHSNAYVAFAISAPRQISSPAPAPTTTQRFLPEAMLPVCLSLIFIAALAVLLVFWLDRRSGRNKMVDRLSETELLRMYPAYLTDSDEGECLICLSDMQRGDTLRALRCEHHFHARCLDPWVCGTRATCPTCRASVRVDHLSDNHREAMCSSNRSCWRLVFCRSSDGEGEQEGQEGLQSREQQEQERSPGAPGDHLHTGGRIVFPDRVNWPMATRTASSTPRTRSTAHSAAETGSESTSLHTALDLSFGSSRREQQLASAEENNEC